MTPIGGALIRGEQCISFIKGKVLPYFIVALIFGAVFFVFSISNVLAQDLTPAPVDQGVPVDSPIDAPLPDAGDFVGETPPSTEDIPAPAGVGTEEAPSSFTEASEDNPSDVLQDIKVTTENLGAKEAAVLPGSFFHPFKKFGRNIQEALTFDPVKKAERQLQHANQELAEIQQLVDEQGMENIDPNIFMDSVEWFENKLGKIKEGAEKIKVEKAGSSQEVEAFLNSYTNQNFYEHKVLEDFDEKITDVKDEMADAENVYLAIKNKQDEVLGHFGEVLTIVDDPENIPERLAAVADSQDGSGFKLIKATEILKKLEDQVPEQGKAAIENAQERTLELLEEDMGEMTPIVRAEKFEEYTAALPGDETVHLSIFDKLKQMEGIPQDMLEKIEEVKEFAVQRFEEKVEKFESPEIKDGFFENLTGDNMSDLMVLEELKAKISAKQEELRARIEAKHAEGIEEFKAQFTDVQSQDQADRFAKLVAEMTANPNSNTFRLIQELEAEVAQDPEKAAFINDIKNKAKSEFENKFRLEGDRFFDRMGSLDPEDMMIFRGFEEDKFFDPAMMDQFFTHQTDRFKERIQGIEDPMMFERFDERMRFAPPEIIELIKSRDAEFGSVMQFKARKMQDAAMELTEREARMEMERAWREMGDEIQRKLRQAASEEEKKAIFEEQRQKEQELMEKEFKQRKAMMEARLTNDPFCDDICQEVQRQYFEQDLEQRKWELNQDSMMRGFDLEMQIAPQMGDPFAGKCDSPESCMQYCFENPDFPPCQAHAPSPPPFMGDMPFGEQFPSPGQGPFPQGGFFQGGPPPCPSGQINMPRGQGEWECVDDPYFKPPEFFKDCPPGNFWNEERGFCEFDNSMFRPMPMPSEGCPKGQWWDPGQGICRSDDRQMPGMPGGDCPPGEWFDPGRGNCIRSDGPIPGPYPMPNYCGPGEYWDDIRGCVREDFKQCGPGEYFDFFEQNCVKDQWQSCTPGEYFDPGRGGCVKDVFVQPSDCPPGQFWDFYKKQCVEDRYMPPPPGMPCAMGEYFDPGRGGCIPSPMPPPGSKPDCGPGEYFDFNVNTCVPSGPPMPSDCPSFAMMPQPCPEGQIREELRDERNCPIFGECIPTPYPSPIPDCGPRMFWDSTRAECIPEQPLGCTDEWAPVCGTDNTTYSNECYSKQAGVGVQYFGECAAGGPSCPQEQYWESRLDRCLYEREYIPSTSGQCEYGWMWMSEGYCAVDTNIVPECETSCQPPCTGSTYCQYDQFGCATGCAESTGSCGNNVCETEENQFSCPGDCYSPVTGSSCNYNNVCDQGETNEGCPADCIQGVGNICGNGACEPGEDYGNCSSDCGGNTACNFNGICENGESSGSCSSDCGGPAAYCGDYICDSGETMDSCPADCSGGGMGGNCPAGFHSHPESGGYCMNDQENYSGTCYDSSGTNIITCPQSTSGGGSCNYNGICDSDEYPYVCPEDCGQEGTACNYNGTCESDESMSSCPDDCGGGTVCNYNGICDGSESATNCPGDCGGAGGTCTSSMYNDYTTSYTCSYSACPNGCNFDSKGCPISCATGVEACGNNFCDPGEDASSCPADCGGSTTACNFNGVCDSGESSGSCPSDCGGSSGGSCSTDYNYCYTDVECNDAGYGWCNGYCWSSYESSPCSTVSTDSCGDGSCTGSETSTSCPVDCGTLPPTTYCGDGTCDAGEDLSNCSMDCGSAYVCGDGVCDPGEDQYLCPGDCQPAEYCGDGICSSSEDSYSCSADCGASYYCGDGSCDPGEDSNNCSSDCGSPPPVLGASTKAYYNVLDASIGYDASQTSKVNINPLNIFKAVFGLLKNTF